MEKQNTAVLIDKEYLHKLKDDVNSCVDAEKAVKHLSLHPFQLIDESAAIKDVLNKGVAKYDKELDGILLGHENITLLDPIAFVPADSCFPHFNVEAIFFIFKPILDKVLVGIVNKKSKDHVGCLVHKVFNVSLPKPKDEKKWIGDRAQIGQEVEFKIIFTDFNGKLPYIRGEILNIVNEDSGISAGEDLAESKPNSITKFDDSDVENTVSKKKKREVKQEESIEAANDESMVTPKKDRKRNYKESESPADEDFVESKTNSIVKFDDGDVEKTATKKRKRKVKEEETIEPTKDESMVTPKKERKRKHKESESPGDEEFSVETPPKKKKRKEARKVDFSDLENIINDSLCEKIPSKNPKKHKKKIKEESP